MNILQTTFGCSNFWVEKFDFYEEAYVCVCVCTVRLHTVDITLRKFFGGRWGSHSLTGPEIDQAIRENQNVFLKFLMASTPLSIVHTETCVYPDR